MFLKYLNPVVRRWMNGRHDAIFGPTRAGKHVANSLSIALCGVRKNNATTDMGARYA